MTQKQTAIQSVIDIHDLIEQVFTTNHSQALPSLIASFHPDFKMIAMNGAKVALTGVMQLFTQKQGTRPSLKITIQNIEVISKCENIVWLRYQENHYENGDLKSAPHQRLSTAGIIIEGIKWQWLYLHETEIQKC